MTKKKKNICDSEMLVLLLLKKEKTRRKKERSESCLSVPCDHRGADRDDSEGCWFASASTGVVFPEASSIHPNCRKGKGNGQRYWMCFISVRRGGGH